jgi:hypothetical protein
MPLLKITRNRFLQTVFIAAVAFAGISARSVQPAVPREYQIKAVFIFNFTQFVDWPKTAFPNAGAPLVIGVLGDNPFGSYLNETVTGEKVDGHPVIVQHYDRVQEIQNCQILFIGLSNREKSEQAIADLKGKSLLTIGDSPDFLKAGGMIKFFTRKNNIRFEINLAAAKSANLTLSSKLLRVAEIFDPKKG